MSIFKRWRIRSSPPPLFCCYVKKVKGKFQSQVQSVDFWQENYESLFPLLLSWCVINSDDEKWLIFSHPFLSLSLENLSFCRIMEKSSIVSDSGRGFGKLTLSTTICRFFSTPSSVPWFPDFDSKQSIEYYMLVSNFIPVSLSYSLCFPFTFQTFDKIRVEATPLLSKPI